MIGCQSINHSSAGKKIVKVINNIISLCRYSCGADFPIFTELEQLLKLYLYRLCYSYCV